MSRSPTKAANPHTPELRSAAEAHAAASLAFEHARSTCWARRDGKLGQHDEQEFARAEVNLKEAATTLERTRAKVDRWNKDQADRRLKLDSDLRKSLPAARDELLSSAIAVQRALDVLVHDLPRLDAAELQYRTVVKLAADLPADSPLQAMTGEIPFAGLPVAVVRAIGTYVKQYATVRAA